MICKKAKEIGKNQFEKIVEKRINSNEEDFYKAVTRNDLKTFVSFKKIPKQCPSPGKNS